MPNLLDRTIQLAFSAGPRNRWCRRLVCRRSGLCLPPRNAEHPHFFRCPFDSEDDWRDRADLAGKIAARLTKVAEKGYVARGLRSPFARPPAIDHLDLSTPLDVAALRDARSGDE